MIADDQQFDVTLKRIEWFQKQMAQLRRTEVNATNYHAASSGFLLEIDRMQRDVREYLQHHPSELAGVA